MTIATSHLETLAIALVDTWPRSLSREGVAGGLRRFAPTTETDGAWLERVTETVRELVRRGVLEPDGQLVKRGDPQELATRLGKGKTWQHAAQRVLPAVALGLRHDDRQSHA